VKATTDDPHKRARSPYITAGGYRALEAETQALWQRRGEVTRALAAAAPRATGPENAEYIYRKKELREIDRASLPAEAAAGAEGGERAAGRRAAGVFGAW